MAGCFRRTICTKAGSTISIGIPSSIHKRITPPALSHPAREARLKFRIGRKQIRRGSDRLRRRIDLFRPWKRDQKKPGLISRPEVAMQANTSTARPQITAITLTMALLAIDGAGWAEIFVTLSILTP